jgi:regulatory protein spx
MEEIMMSITFFTYPSCTSCRKTKKWLQTNHIHFEERHLFRQSPTSEEIYLLLTLTTDGLDELLATRSQSYKDLNVNVDDLPLSEVVELIANNPKLLRRPIMTDGKQLIVGYQPEYLKSFNRKSKLCHAV